jgi:hypothetical protein
VAWELRHGMQSRLLFCLSQGLDGNADLSRFPSGRGIARQFRRR